ncbi:PAS domain S-box protein [Thiomicrorhabdus sp. Milos-T2]|uniref:PAS domain S-box protein n=1 Tax=Thiomicrorhabdus sp. Milos-T2 TaxID=90814 RepID=UPI00068922BB|nr:PAS domain S-box protein [Thiomicrorhabdus sp. Milos-T2]
METQHLKDSAARMRAIVETVPDGIITISKKGIIETVNPAVLKMFGYESSELLGQNVKVLMPEPYHSEHDGYLGHYHDTGEKKVIGIGREVRAQRKDGSIFPIELSVSEMNVSGEIMFTGVINDISAEVEATKKQKDLQNRNKAILDTVVDGIITINHKGCVETVNPAAEKIFGYSADEIIGENVKILMPNPYRDQHDGYLAHHIQTGEKKIIGIGREVEGLRKDGTVFPLELSVSEMVVNDEILFTGIVRDITERKESEKIKEEFISTVSHELRTPLTSIRGSIGLLTGGMAGEFNEQAQKLLNMAHNNTERLLMLINDILDVSKLESGKMDFNFAPVDVEHLLTQAIESNHGYANQHNVKFVLDNEVSGAKIHGDEHRLMQVMNNLMSNAAKFAPEGDEIVIAAIRHHQQIRISVTDHGPGIPKALEPKIFDKFTQADSSDTRQIGGTGLGLNITKAMVEKHNGRIAFVSELGVGTTFYIDLPEQVVVEKSIAIPKDTGNPSQRILICEDEADIASLLRLMLAQAGFDSDTANTADDAKKLLQENDYVAMTLDIMLPGKNGVDLYKELREDPQQHNLPIVFVSAKANQTKVREGKTLAGIVEWINKPIDESAFIDAIENSINHLSTSKENSILHVEDDEDICKLVDMLLGEKFKMNQAGSLAEAKKLLSENCYDLLLLDIGLPDGSGLDLIEYIRTLSKTPEVVIFSADDIKINQKMPVAETLVKSRTTNNELVEKIEKIVTKNN